MQICKYVKMSVFHELFKLKQVNTGPLLCVFNVLCVFLIYRLKLNYALDCHVSCKLG